MPYVAVMSVDGSGNVEKFLDFDLLADAQAHITAFIGTYPDAYAVVSPGGGPRDWVANTGAETLVYSAVNALADAKVAKKSSVDALHLSKNTANFTSGGNVYDASAAGQLNIAHAISYGELNSISGATTRSWTLADNSTVTVTWTVLRAMATAMFERVDANHTNCRTHKDAIDALSTVAAIDSYDFSTGWT